MRRIILFLFITVLACGGLVACGNKEAADADKPVVAVSIMPETQWVESIVGDDYRVVSMIPQGASPETYEPTQEDMQAFSDAKVFFSIGVPAEDKLIAAAEEADVPVVKLDDVIRARYGDLTMAPHSHDHDHDATDEHDHDHDHDAEAEHNDAAMTKEVVHANTATDRAEIAAEEHEETTEAHEHDHDGQKAYDHGHDHGANGMVRDPHIWLSTERAEVAVLAIAAEMADINPEAADTYEENAQDYVKKLKETAADIQEIFADKAHKDFIIAHPAFGYYADQFSLMQHGLEADGKEATADHLAHLIDFAKENGITAVFYDESHAAKQAETFAEEIGGEAIEINPLAENYCENLLEVAKTMAAHMK